MKLKLTLIYTTPIILGLLGFIFLARMESYCDFDISTFYSQNLRSSLFGGFLTMGGFLLSLKTGILIKIKEQLYDKKEYHDLVNSQLIIGGDASIYKPLRNLSDILSISVFFCLLSALLQFTIGLIDSKIATAVCISFAATSMSYLISSFILIKQNLNAWFDFMENPPTTEPTKKTTDDFWC